MISDLIRRLRGLPTEAQEREYQLIAAKSGAESFMEIARAKGYLVRDPLKDTPHIVVLPLAMSDGSGSTVFIYADFSDFRLIQVSGEHRKTTTIPPPNFLPSLFELLNKYGPIRQADGQYRWSADGNHKLGCGK